MLHHVASAEIYYTMWLDDTLPDETIARYREASRRFGALLERAVLATGAEGAAFYDGAERVTVTQVARAALEAEQALLAVEGDGAA